MWSIYRCLRQEGVGGCMKPLCISWLCFRWIYECPLRVLVECVYGGFMLFVVEIEFIEADFI
jgi:hypothetical protein